MHDSKVQEAGNRSAASCGSCISELCASLDDTESWLRDGDAAALRRIDAGLNVAFDEDSRATYRKLAADPALMEEGIERVSYETERRLNMDW